MAPTGNYGSIVEVLMRKAGTHRVSDTDSRSLVEFWKEIYDIDICPDEIPLLKEQKTDLQTQLLQETRQRLFGRNVSAWGSVLSVHDELWFFPSQIRFS